MVSFDWSLSQADGMKYTVKMTWISSYGSLLSFFSYGILTGDESEPSSRDEDSHVTVARGLKGIVWVFRSFAKEH
jgi:hypothetical protein